MARSRWNLPLSPIM